MKQYQINIIKKNKRRFSYIVRYILLNVTLISYKTISQSVYTHSTSITTIYWRYNLIRA